MEPSMNGPLIFTNVYGKKNKQTIERFPNPYSPSSPLQMQLLLLPILAVTWSFQFGICKLSFIRNTSNAISKSINEECSITACSNFSTLIFC